MESLGKQEIIKKYGLKETLSTQTQETRLTELPANGKLNKRPPLVTPNRYPDSIMFSIMGSDMETMKKYLLAYQKTRPEWDVYRNKIPEPILIKFSKVLNECRENGFIWPTVVGDDIIWHQILTSERTKKNTDKCTMCSKRFLDGDCMGKIKLQSNHWNFVTCWR